MWRWCGVVLTVVLWCSDIHQSVPRLHGHAAPHHQLAPNLRHLAARGAESVGRPLVSGLEVGPVSCATILFWRVRQFEQQSVHLAVPIPA